MFYFIAICFVATPNDNTDSLYYNALFTSIRQYCQTINFSEQQYVVKKAFLCTSRMITSAAKLGLTLTILSLVRSTQTLASSGKKTLAFGICVSFSVQ